MTKMYKRMSGSATNMCAESKMGAQVSGKKCHNVQIALIKVQNLIAICAYTEITSALKI